METFKIKESEDYIELNNLIKKRGWVATGGEAKTRIDQEEVRVNGEIETRRRRKIRIGDQVVFGDQKVQIE
jgi:ribosome-associated protein